MYTDFFKSLESNLYTDTLQSIQYPLNVPPGDITTTHPEMDFRELAPESNPEIDTSYLTHTIQKHPATFIPHIPSYLIRTIVGTGTGKTILDCFSGRGTTGIESLNAGHNYVGIELNPLSHLISTVATQPIPESVGDELMDTIQTQLQAGLTETDTVEFPGRTKKSHWFEPSAITALEQLRHLIKTDPIPDNIEVVLTEQEKQTLTQSDISYSELRNRCQNILTLTLANTVFKVSNADPGVSKAYKSPKMKEAIKDGSHPPDTLTTFEQECTRVVNSITAFWTRLQDAYTTIPISTVILGDSRTFELPDEIPDIDLAITSPPYINAINYYRGSKLRLFWIQDLLPESSLSPTELRKSIIGSNSSVSQSDVPETAPTLRSLWNGTDTEYTATRLPELDETLQSIYQGESDTAEKKSVLTQQFFSRDMAQTLAQVQDVLKDTGIFFFVVGDNVVEKQPVHIHRYVEDIATNLHQFSTTDCTDPYTHIGTAFDTITNRELFKTRNHEGGVIECEWIITLQK